MSGFIEVTSVEGLEPGTMREVEVDGHQFLVARIGDTYHVTDGRCPHLGGHLAQGVLDGVVVTCPRHHSQFDLTDGSCLRWTDWTGAVLTVAELAKHPRPLRSYESKVEDGKVYVGPQKPPGRVPE
jgi:3-phenylpropionate/trans-cinnamate dioxygenase ferredoxin component